MLTSYWQNPARPLDTDNDTLVLPVDALLIINELNSPLHTGLPGIRTNPLSAYLDTSGDDFITPLDALLIINELNSNRSGPTYPIVRRPGGEEVGPAGFVSRTLFQLPGEQGERYEVSLNWDAKYKAFHELGLFAVDDVLGHVGGLDVGSQAYPHQVFDDPEKQVVFSMHALESPMGSAVFDGGQWVALYVLQRQSETGNSHSHISIDSIDPNDFQISWQELPFGQNNHPTPYLDSQLSGNVRPVNLNPSITSEPITVIGDDSNYIYHVQASDPFGDPLQFKLLAGPNSMSVDRETGIVGWSAADSTVGSHFVEIEVTDDRGGFKRQNFNLEVVASLPNRPPTILSTPVDKIEVERSSSIYASQTVNFDSWTSQTFLSYWDESIWTLNRNNQQITQTNTLAPTYLISDFEISNHRFEGTVNSNFYFGGGYFGIVFGYQDDQHFYLFDWKQGDGDPNDGRGIALGGMSVKRFASTTPLTEQDYWQTQVDPAKGETLFHNTLNWDRGDYLITLEQTPGHVLIQVSLEGVVHETIDLDIPDLVSGKVGLYTNYQSPSTFSDFQTKLFGGSQYQYQLRAFDPDGDQLTYRLLEGPRDMQLDTNTGKLTWQPTFQDVGDQHVLVEVDDGHGGVVTQEYVLCVHPPTVNAAPVIVSAPVEDYDERVAPEAYHYQVQAIDADSEQLSYTLLEAPQGMRINPTTGLITWPLDDMHSYRNWGFFQEWLRFWGSRVGGTDHIRIQVADEQGATDIQEFDLFTYVAEPASISGYVYEDANRNGILDTTFVQGDDPYIVFVIDDSCSMDDPWVGDPVGDLNGDDLFDTYFDAALAGIRILADRLAQDPRQADTKISLTGFGFVYDLNPTLEGPQYFVGIGDDADGNGVRDFEDVFLSMVTACGGTDYEAAMLAAIRAFDAETTSEDSRNVLFMTDGMPERSGPYEDDVQTLHDMGVNLQGLGIGRGTLTEPLQNVDPNAHEISYTKELIETFEGLDITGFEATEPVLAGWTVYLDENDNAVFDDFELSTTSNVNGFYKFDDVPIGKEYRIRTVVPEQWYQVAPTTGNYAAAMFTGEQVRAFNFGNLPIIAGPRELPPQFLSTPQGTATVGDFYRYQAVATDPDSTAVTYQLILGPSNATIHPSQGTLFWQPVAENIGTNNFIVRAVDATGQGVQQAFTVNVLPLNTAPFVTSIPPAVWPVGSRTDYRLAIQDAENDDVSVRVLSGPTDLSLDSATHTLSWIPNADYTGIVLSDDPIAYWNFDQVINDTVIPDLSGNGYDALADVAVSIASSPIGENNLGISTNAATISVPTGTAMPLKEFTFEAWVKSSPDRNNTWIMGGTNHYNGYGIDLFQGAFGADAFSFTGTGYEIPQPLDQWRYLVGTFSNEYRRFYVDGQLVDERESYQPWDPRGGFEIGLMYGWNGDVDEVAIYDYPLSQDQITSHFTSAIQQPRMARIEVTDSRGASTVHEIAMYTHAGYDNQPPTITSIFPHRVPVGQQLVHQVQAYDQNGDGLTYTLLEAPPGMSIDSAGVIRWTPGSNQLGEHQVIVEVTDSIGAAVTQSASITVVTHTLNSAPSIESTPAHHAVAGHTFGYDASALDRDGDSLIWTLTEAPVGASVDALSGRVRWTPGYDQVGSQRFQISVQDAFGGFDSQSFVVDVSCFNLQPQIHSTPPTLATVGLQYLYRLDVYDAESDPIQWQLVDGPSGMLLDDHGNVSWAPTVGQVGLHTVHIAVSDGLNTVDHRYSIDVLDPAVNNRAPIIVSSPVYYASTGSEYSYAFMAIDPEGGPLTYSAGSQLPAGMSMDATGLLTWTPELSQAGLHTIKLLATDPGGLTATQTYLLTVERNLPPVITSTPSTEMTAGAMYRYLVKAFDPEGSDLEYRLDTAPSGMTIDALGGIRWQSSPDTASPQSITVSVFDASGQSTSQSWEVALAADQEPPIAQVTVISGTRNFIEDATLDVGSVFQVRVSGIDNVAIRSYQLEIDGTPVALDEHGIASILSEHVGTLQLVGTVTDSAGLTGSDTLSVQVVDPAIANAPIPTDPTLPPNPGPDPSDTGVPFVEITSPEGAATVSNLVPIIGTVDDPEDNLWFYRVYYARADRVDLTQLDMDDPDWVIIKTSTEEVIDGELAVFDSTLVSNDPYTIAVAAFDVNGLGYIQPTQVYVEGNVDIGNFKIDITDLSIPLAGIPIQITRTYDTHNALDEGDFGFGWTMSIADARIFEAAAVGEGGVFTAGNDKFVPDRTKVYLTNPEGQRVGFTYKEQYQTGCSSIFGCLFGAVYRPYFEPDLGVYDTLTIDEGRVFRGGISGALGQGINPEFYTLTTKHGISYRYSDEAGLQTIADRHGNVVTVTATSMTHSSGQSIQFVRDAQGRVEQILDPAGNAITYSYDAAGDLRKVTDQIGLETSYNYRTDHPHYLDEAFNSLGNRVFEVQYDADGKYIGIVDALGNTSSQEFQTNNNYGIVRDALGNARTLHYDDRGNVLREIDPLGQETIREYADPNNPDLETRIVDRNGFITDRSYDPRGNVLSITEMGTASNPLAQPVVTNFTYDRTNNVQSITNGLGNSTTFQYDDQGLLTRITNATGDSSSFTYDDQGRRASFTDFNGNTTRFEYQSSCPCGSPAKVSFADGAYQTFEYNGYGQVTEQASYEPDGTLAEIKQTDFDERGRPIEERQGLPGNPAQPQTVVRKFYTGHLLDWEIIVHPDSLDAEGNLLESPATPVADRKSRITVYEYDAADRIIRQTDAEGGVVEFRYDANGNRILLQDPVGNITTWVYDSLQRMAEERDPFYNEGLTIDQAIAELANPSGADLAANQGADHVRAFAYDHEGNQAEMIDRNGRRREFDYDHAGRLTEERWYAADTGTLVETIAFGYDLLGNMLTASDSNSNYLYTYDVLNRMTSVDNNPDGTRDVPRVILTYGYDAQGNVTLTQDDAGVTVASTYDARNRLDVRLWYDALVPTGEDPDVDPVRVEFDYNAANRESEVRRYSGLDTSQLVGRTVRTYDSAGRSDLLNHLSATDELLAGYDYDYDFGSLVLHESRSHQNSDYAQEIDYGYDLTGQLVDALFSGQDDEHFRYDLNGNRITSSLGDEARTYTTGVANQLTSDSVYRYEYDGEGNQVKRVHLTTGETRTMQYDHHNRLVRVDDWSADPGDLQNPAPGAVLMQSVEYTYDAFGRKLDNAVDSDGEAEQPSTTQRYAYDGIDVWADYSSDTSTTVRYLANAEIDDALAYFNASGVSFTLHDRVSSVVGISDSVGQLAAYASYDLSGQFGRAHNADLIGRFRLHGREIDNFSQDYFFRARWWSSTSGRFTTQDPLRFGGDDTNMYRSFSNSVQNFRDPLGLLATIEFRILRSAFVSQVSGGLGFAVGANAGTLLGAGCVLLGALSGVHVDRDLTLAIVQASGLAGYAVGVAIGFTLSWKNTITIKDIADFKPVFQALLRDYAVKSLFVTGGVSVPLALGTSCFAKPAE